MCVAFPGRVVEVDEFGASVDTEGRRRRASTLLVPDVAVGDWVAVAAGTIVERLEEAQALEIVQLLKEAVALEVAEDDESATMARMAPLSRAAEVSAAGTEAREGGRRVLAE